MVHISASRHIRWWKWSEADRPRPANRVRVRANIHGGWNDGTRELAIRLSRMDRPIGPNERWCQVKLKHWLFVAFVIIGVLFLWHNYSQHGGVAGVKSGLGLS